MGHFLVILNTSGSRGFELQVRVWSGLTILQKFGFGFVGFHFQTSCFWVSRFQSRLSSLRLGLHILISVGSGSEIFGFGFANLPRVRVRVCSGLLQTEIFGFGFKTSGLSGFSGFRLHVLWHFYVTIFSEYPISTNFFREIFPIYY